MPTVTRAVVVWDHTCGSLREDAGRILGLDLSPSIEAAAAAFTAAGRELVLAVSGWPPDEPAASFTAGTRLRVVPIAALSWRPANDDTDAARDPGAPAGARAASTAGSAELASTVFVSADRRLRGEAAAAGMRPLAHPAALALLMRSGEIRPARVAGPKSTLERLAARGGVVPLQFQPAPGIEGASGAWALFGWFDPERLIDAALQGLCVATLPYDPGTHDLVWVRPGDERAHADADAGAGDARAALRRRSIVYAEPGQILLALGPGEDVEALGLHGEHGHTEFLAPDPGLLLRASDGDVGVAFASEVPPDVAPILEPVELPPLEQRRILRSLLSCRRVTAKYASDLDRYSGVTPLDTAGAIVSRHVLHPDNRRVEAQLLADLSAMGYCAHRHDFVHAGSTYSNIVADLPGAGWFRIRPAVLRLLRKELARPGQPDVTELSRLLDDIDAARTDAHGAAAAGEAAATSWAQLAQASPQQARRAFEAMLKLRPWYPWWKLRCPVPGWGAGLVLVGAHLDATAGFDPGYAPATDAAPGRDDNASGLAAVLAMARHFRAYAGQLRHTVRFCLFNAEEAGLVGSKAYAAHLKALGAPVRAVVCMDMIGYNADANQLFEIHTGHTDAAVRDLGQPFADRIAAAAAAHGVLAPAQIYRGTSSAAGAPDRNLYDGAINRSDHAAFQQQGWGAALVSEDFFINLASEPARDANPNYHRGADQVTDLTYARAIVCAVARAVAELAD